MKIFREKVSIICIYCIKSQTLTHLFHFILIDRFFYLW